MTFLKPSVLIIGTFASMASGTGSENRARRRGVPVSTISSSTTGISVRPLLWLPLVMTAKSICPSNRRSQRKLPSPSETRTVMRGNSLRMRCNSGGVTM